MTKLILCENQRYESIVLQQDQDIRLDAFITKKFPRYSRSFFKKLLETGNVMVNNKICTKAGYKLKINDLISFIIPAKKNNLSHEDSHAIEILYTHPEFLVINKPAGLLVHKPHSHSSEPTVVDWIINWDSSITSIGQVDRPGIVHRLDKDTSGILIIPRTNYAHNYFSDLFKKRKIHKIYLAVVQGHPAQSFSCNFPIGRHPHIKTKMIAHEKLVSYPMREALTNGSVLQYFATTSLIELKPTTGRTHQLRVHCATIGYPLVGDKVYGKSDTRIMRHALHAKSVSFKFQDKDYIISCNAPNDFEKLISIVSEEK